MSLSTKGNPIIMYIALFAVLVVLPGVGWIYLQRGLDYQRDIRADLANHGDLPELNTQYLFQGEIPDSLAGSLYIIGFADLSDATTAAYYGGQFDKLQQQFPAPELVKMISFFPNTVDDQQLNSFLEEHKFKTKTQALVYQLPQEEFDQKLKAFAFPEDMIFGSNNPLVTVVDDSLHIRNHYQIIQEEELFKLVEQVAIIAPKPPEKSVIFAPEKEK